jgi:uncharacterized protein (TIGR03118 family)
MFTRKLGVLLAAAAIPAAGTLAQNAYDNVVLVANRPEFQPQIVDPLLVDGWGIAIRPPGAGGHFWISNTGSGNTTLYVGDVPGVPLYQDDLAVVDIPKGGVFYNLPDKLSEPTGQVYSGHSLTDFVVSGENITGPSKFIFVTLDGTVSGWTTGQSRAVTMIDKSAEGRMYSGIATTTFPTNNRIYVVEFGQHYGVEVYDANWQPVQVSGNFRDPAADELFEIWNIQYMDGKLYATWAQMTDDPGEEEHYPGYGMVSVFDLEGNLLQSFERGPFLNAPWGLAIAPDGFGALSGKLLVANFGDGTTLAFDRATGRLYDYLRDARGEPLVADGIWGMTFGNGVRLGYANHCYYAAGPNAEEDGVFGKFKPVDCPGDFDGSGLKAPADIFAFLNAYFASSRRADWNGDAANSPADIFAFLSSYFTGC